MLGKLLQRWRKPPVDSADELASFLERNAWYVTQKTIIGYCTVKTRLPVHELMWDKPFAEAYDISLWEAYAAVLADLAMVAGLYLRAHANGHGRAVAAALGATYEALVSAHPLPKHRPQGWGEEVASARRRLEESLALPPQSIRNIATTSAERVIATLPFHQRLREPDAPAVTANVQFLMVGLAHEFESRLDGAAIVADMVARSDMKNPLRP